MCGVQLQWWIDAFEDENIEVPTLNDNESSC
jgi:hypothetical protein